jgi:hypothetical protein
MNDSELITMVRESFTPVHVTTPVQQITSRGRAVRARRRIPALAGALAVAAGAVIAVTSIHPAIPRASHQPTAPLAAWTVAKQSDGTIQVTLRQLSDPAGLQRELRADSVPASLTLIGQQNPACRPYHASRTLLDSVVTHTFEILPTVHHGPPTGLPGSALSLVIVMDIHPSALPSGIGVQLATTFTLLPPVIANGGTQRVAHTGVAMGLVYASPQCTG